MTNTAAIYQASVSENTRRAYERDLVYWEAWLRASGRNGLDEVQQADVVAFVLDHMGQMPPALEADLVRLGVKRKSGQHGLATIKRRVASLSAYCLSRGLESPCRSAEVRLLLESAGRLNVKQGRSSKAKRALTRPLLLKLLATCGDDARGVRDKALLLFGWASGGRRRSEIAEACVEQLEPIRAGFVYTVAHGKTDQLGVGLPVPVLGTAAEALKDWIALAGIQSGPIFRQIDAKGQIGGELSGRAVAEIIKRRCRMAGLNPRLYGGHSLRSGFMSQAGRDKIALADAMAISGHRSAAVALRYHQAGGLLSNPASHLIEAKQA